MKLLRLRAIACVALFLLPVTGAMAADRMRVVLDQAGLEKLPSGATTVVIGNPLIADVTLQQGGMMVVTGKGYGTTNFIAMDREGKVLAERTIEVVGPWGDTVVVYRGTERESYSCTPHCERRLTLGDSAGFFDPMLAQANARNTQALGASGNRP